MLTHKDKDFLRLAQDYNSARIKKKTTWTSWAKYLLMSMRYRNCRVRKIFAAFRRVM